MSKKVNYWYNKNSHYVKYHPELKRIFGSQQAAIIFKRLEYWSSKYSIGFWKFFEPCEKHPQYKKGDSWKEELELSRRVFLKAFSFIGIHYKSKSDYLAQSDPFQGKMYASYYNRKTNRTYFLRDHSKVEQFLTSLWQGAKKISKTIKEKVQKCRSGNDTNSRSFVRALDISLQTSTSSQELPEPEPIPPEPDVVEEKDKNLKVAEDMMKIWNNITSNKQRLNDYFKTKLPETLIESFQGSLESWTEFCLTVASSKFLMGEAPNTSFKAFLAWVIKPSIVENIREKQYSLGDREVNYYRTSPKSSETFNPEHIQGTDNWKQVCEQLCSRLGYATFNSWFKDLKFLKEETTQPVLHCPTRFMRDWIRTHYQGQLERVVKQILPHITNLEISA
jgi:hypothetical protein